MKKSSEYSAQELAVMSLEQLLAFLRLAKEEQSVHSTHQPSAASTTSPGRSPHDALEGGRRPANPGPSPEALRIIGGL